MIVLVFVNYLVAILQINENKFTSLREGYTQYNTQPFSVTASAWQTNIRVGVLKTMRDTMVVMFLSTSLTGHWSNIRTL